MEIRSRCSLYQRNMVSQRGRGCDPEYHPGVHFGTLNTTPRQRPNSIYTSTRLLLHLNARFLFCVFPIPHQQVRGFRYPRLQDHHRPVSTSNDHSKVALCSLRPQSQKVHHVEGNKIRRKLVYTILTKAPVYNKGSLSSSWISPIPHKSTTSTTILIHIPQDGTEQRRL